MYLQWKVNQHLNNINTILTNVSVPLDKDMNRGMDKGMDIDMDMGIGSRVSMDDLEMVDMVDMGKMEDIVTNECLVLEQDKGYYRDLMKQCQ